MYATYSLVLSVQMEKNYDIVVISKQEVIVWMYQIFDGILNGAMNAV